LIFSHATPLSGWRGTHTRTEDFNKKESANELARLLTTNAWHSTKGHVLFVRVINSAALEFTLPFEFDSNMAKRFPSGNCIGTLYLPQLLAGPRPVLQRVPVRLVCLRPRRRRAPVHPVDVDPVGRAHPGLEHLHFDRLGHQVVRCCSRHPTTLASITAPIAELRHTPSLQWQ
jgi:hypothetical protein